MAMTVLSESAVIPMLAEGDLTRARQFWKDTLGFEEVFYDESYGEAAFRANGTIFAMYQHEGGSRADHTQLAFQVDDVRAAVQDLRAAGVRFEEYDLPNVKTTNGIAEMGPGEEGAWFLDPGGNIIGLFTTSGRLTEQLRMSASMAGASR